MLYNLKTGLIYRNPIPHVKSIHAYFPSVAVNKYGGMLATLVLGEAFEAWVDHPMWLDYAVFFAEGF